MSAAIAIALVPNEKIIDRRALAPRMRDELHANVAVLQDIICPRLSGPSTIIV